jgi:predicted secreted protein
MKIGTLIAMYFVIWWICLFGVLPLRVRTQGEAGDVVPGTPASAPDRPQLLLKAAITTAVAAIVLAGIVGLLNSGLALDDIPFLPKFSTPR